MEKIVVTIGELVVDWISLEQGLDWGESRTFLRSPGGNAANVAQALGRLGTKARLVAKIGRDIHADYLLESLASAGVDVDHVYLTDEYATAQCYVLTDGRGENAFYNWPRPNACHKLTTSDLGDVMVGPEIGIVHTTGISLTVEPRSSTIIEAIRIALKQGVVVSFDAGFPTGEGEKARAKVLEAMSMAHILKVNLPELYYWLGIEEDVDALEIDAAGLEKVQAHGRELRARTACEILLLTLGGQGSLILSDRECIYTPAVPVQSLDGVGAGDAYCAAVLHKLIAVPFKPGSLAEALDWHEAGRFANIVGALATRTVSASQGLPTLEEVENFHARHF